MAVIKSSSNGIGAEQAPGVDPQKQNEIVRKWLRIVQGRLTQSTSGFTHGKAGTVSKRYRIEKKLTASLKSETKQNYGVIDRASLVFERHGIFVHKGVGRGYKMAGGVVTRTAKSVSPAVTRRPVEWFNPIINLMIPELVRDLEEVNIDAVINATRLTIR